MGCSKVRFSIAECAAWAPGIETREAWEAWAKEPFRINENSAPKVSAMPPMLRRRASFLARLALEVAYQCLGEKSEIPTIFCSQHGEVSRSMQMLSDLAEGNTISPTSFGLSVHNAIGGLFSIARSDKANNIALAGGVNTVENGVIEACGLINDGEPQVLLVVYDCPLPPILQAFQDESEQPYAWAWLIEAPQKDALSLEWLSANHTSNIEPDKTLPAGLQVLGFYLRKDQQLIRETDHQQWRWSRNA